MKVNIINTFNIPMSEAVTVPTLMKMTLIVSEESLVTNRQTDKHTHTHTHTRSIGVVYLKLFRGKTTNKIGRKRDTQNSRKKSPKTTVLLAIE